MAFWLAALLLALICGAWLARPLLAGRAAAAPRAAHDLQVFRDQLRAVERDVARGVLPEAEAEGARAEISRRLLAAAAEAEAAAPADAAPRGASRLLAAALGLLLLGGGAGVYAMIGAPGLPDRPLAQRLADIRAAEPPRPSQAEAERLEADRRAAEAPATAAAPLADDPETARLRDLVARLRGLLEDRPDDVRGRRLLADSLLRLEDPAGAQAAMREAVELQGDAVAPADRAALAETMILAAGGYVSPEAERQLGLALQAEPGQPVARYYAGLALAQTGRYGLALRFWRALLREGPQDAPWIAPIRAQIGELERIAAAAGDLPPEAPGGSGSGALPPGPSEEDVQAAQDLSPEDRDAMIRGMVARLENRLAEDGGPPEEWARLISAYGVLNRPEDAARIWKDAERAFADAPDALNRLRGAAVDAGVTEALE